MHVGLGLQLLTRRSGQPAAKVDVMESCPFFFFFVPLDNKGEKKKKEKPHTHTNTYTHARTHTPKIPKQTNKQPG